VRLVEERPCELGDAPEAALVADPGDEEVIALRSAIPPVGAPWISCA
jgi:hypothetical protein